MISPVVAAFLWRSVCFLFPFAPQLPHKPLAPSLPLSKPPQYPHPTPFSPIHHTAVCCILQCAETTRIPQHFRALSASMRQILRIQRSHCQNKPKSKQHLCVAALVQRAQNCRNDLALLEANMRKKLDDAETRCKTHCGTNEPCFSACTNVFSARTAQFEQTLANLHPLCNTITTQIPTCLSLPQPPHQQKSLLACLSLCNLP